MIPAMKMQIPAAMFQTIAYAGVMNTAIPSQAALKLPALDAMTVITGSQPVTIKNAKKIAA